MSKITLNVSLLRRVDCELKLSSCSSIY